jgi:GNAT superfamily N-acetyltransferase/DNA-directed RNA polymerase specialized sigma24 family protein
MHDVCVTTSAADSDARRVEVVDLSGASNQSELIRRLCVEIVQPSIPPGELEAVGSLADRLCSGSEEAFVAAAMVGDVPVGAIVADLLTQSGVLLVSYLAVRPHSRECGVGSALLELLPLWRERAAASVVVVEVKDPRFHRLGGFGDPARRLRFYLRGGFAAIPLPFVQPRLGKAGERVDGFLLLAMSGSPTVPAATVRSFVSEYVTRVEGVDPEREMCYAGLLAALDRQDDPLSLLPLERYTEVSPVDIVEELLRRDYPLTAAATDLLGVDHRAVEVLNRVWVRVIGRMAAGESLPRPRAAVMAELIDELAAEELLYESDDPADRAVMTGWFSGAGDPWAGWWLRTPPAWGSDLAVSHLASRAVRRLPLLPRAALVMADVARLELAEAAGITGYPIADHRSILSAARTEVVALIDQSIEGGEDGRGPSV